ncbi:preprotein translocase subunit YajC [Croceibacterium soli]
MRSLIAMLAMLALPAVAAAQDSPQSRGSGSRTQVTPYIEAAQVLTAEIEPESDLVTYTTVAAGVDATVVGRNSAGSASLRYERHIGYGDEVADSDTVSGIARASVALVPRAVTIEAGALASRTRVDESGGTFAGAFAQDDGSTSQVYSGYVGPSVQTRSGDVQAEGHYRFGYTRVESPDAVTVGAGGARPIDLADESTTHAAQARVGLAPYGVLPIGVGIGGGWNEQNVSNLDQRIRDRHVRGDVIVPVSPVLAVVGGVGYEDVQVSSRDAVRDASGNPVIGDDGRFVTDKSAPRVIAYETDGLIWDVGVMWRPSRRTSLEAFVGRRYDSTTYYGSFAYAPTSRQSINVSVYDGITSFGGVIADRLAGLPTQFQAVRNAFSGEIGGCVASVEGANCLSGALGSLNSAVFRGRGASLSYAIDLGRTQAGIGAGYDRRRFIAAPGTVLAAANSVVDESYWAMAYASTQLDQRSSLSGNATVNWFESGFDGGQAAIGYSASLAYYRQIIAGLSGTAAIGLDGITQDSLPDLMSASALLGLRYSF